LLSLVQDRGARLLTACDGFHRRLRGLFGHRLPQRHLRRGLPRAPLVTSPVPLRLHLSESQSAQKVRPAKKVPKWCASVYRCTPSAYCGGESHGVGGRCGECARVHRCTLSKPGNIAGASAPARDKRSVYRCTMSKQCRSECPGLTPRRRHAVIHGPLQRALQRRRPRPLPAGTTTPHTVLSYSFGVTYFCVHARANASSLYTTIIIPRANTTLVTPRANSDTHNALSLHYHS